MEIKYRKVLEILKGEILRGKYSSSSAFPSKAMLIRRFGISNLTAVKVVSKLKDEGLVRSCQGRGTFVTRAANSRKIGLILPGLAYSEFFEPIASALIRHAREKECVLLFSDVFSKDAQKRGKEAVERAKDLVSHHVSGVLFQPLEGFVGCEDANRQVLSILKESGIQVVLLDSDYAPGLMRSGYDVVSLNNLEAGMQLTRHLVEQGAKNIHFLHWPDHSPSVEEREFGMSVVISRMKGGGFAKKGMCSLVADPSDAEVVRKYCRRNRPDAFVCATDMAAAQLKQSLERCGKRVPEDILLAGFDDVRVARFMTPPLTTIHQSCDDIARMAFDRLLERLANPCLKGAEINVYGTLVVRDSTRRPEKSSAKRRKV